VVVALRMPSLLLTGFLTLAALAVPAHAETGCSASADPTQLTFGEGTSEGLGVTCTDDETGSQACFELLAEDNYLWSDGSTVAGEDTDFTTGDCETSPGAGATCDAWTVDDSSLAGASCALAGPAGEGLADACAYVLGAYLFVANPLTNEECGATGGAPVGEAFSCSTRSDAAAGLDCSSGDVRACLALEQPVGEDTYLLLLGWTVGRETAPVTPSCTDDGLGGDTPLLACDLAGDAAATLDCSVAGEHACLRLLTDDNYLFSLAC
jgi:hypothetical protein